MKKRALSIFLCIALALSFVQVPAFATTGADGSISISVGQTTLKAGETTDVTFQVNATSDAVGAVNFTVNIPSGLEYVSHEVLVSTSDFLMSSYTPEDGKFGCGVTAAGKTGAFNVLKLTVRAKDANLGNNAIGATIGDMYKVDGSTTMDFGSIDSVNIYTYKELTGDQTITMGTKPAAGSNADTVTATGSAGIKEVKFSDWKKGTEDLTGNFEADKAYTATGTLTADDGYVFAEATTVKLTSAEANESVENSQVTEAGKKLTFTYKYTTPALPAYDGAAAGAPSLDTKAGGNVTLNTVSVTGESTEYGYSTSNDKVTAGNWQDSTAFTGLAAGDYYFYARVKANGTTHSGGGVSDASDKITVFAKPEITGYSGNLNDMTIGTAITDITPVVIVPAGPAVSNPFKMTGTLPTGLSFDQSNGKISGTPTTYAESGGSVNITVTDKEGITSEAYTLNFGPVKKKTQSITASDVNATYGDTDKSISATAEGPVSYAVKTGSEEYIDVNSSDGKLTIKKAGNAWVTVTAAATAEYAQATKDVKVTISPKALTSGMIGTIAVQTYTGSAIKPEPTVTGLTKGTDFDYSYENNTYVGTAKVKITGKGNYTGTAEKSFNIVAADQTPTIAPTASLKKGGKTLNLTTLVNNVKGGAEVSFEISTGDAATLSGTTLITDATKTGEVKINVKIAAKDVGGDSEVEYKAYTGTNAITVTVNDKDTQAPLNINSATSVVYGKTLKLSTSGGSGAGAVSYEIVAGGTGTATISGNVLTPTKAGTVLVKATKAGNEDYNEASAQLEITIEQATPTGKPAYTKITEADKTLAAAALAAGTLNPSAGELKWVDDSDSELSPTTTVEKNKAYKWKFIPTDTNYKAVSGTITPYYVAPAGGGIISSVQKPTIEAGEGVKVTLSSDGTVATITVDPAYDLADVVLNGVSKGKVTEVKGLKTGDKLVVTAAKKAAEPTEPTDEEILATLADQKLVARSKVVTMKNGKKAVRITWYNQNGEMMEFDGVQIYRSTKKNSGYGKKPIFTSETDKYYNTAIKAGTKYYYKLRGFVVIDGQKYYTDYSLKAIRTVK